MKECLHETTSFARAAVRGPRLAAALVALSFAAHLTPASAQFKLQQTFTGTAAPGWTLSGNAFLTAPSIDPDGQGWLRLTDANQAERGLALDTAETFTGNVPVTIRFSYVSWGGDGADGITVFLYDSTQDMSGAANGGGLGYCGGAGGYLGIGLDEYGNFSNPGDHCGAAGGGPGNIPESLVIRGPLSASDQYVTGVQVPGGIDNPFVGTRPPAKTVVVTLTPATVGYTVTALMQSDSSQPFQTLFSNVPFPFAAPASLSVGFTGSTGGSTNIHELQGLVTATPDDLQVSMSGPATALQNTPVGYTVTLTNNGAYPIGAADAPTLSDVLPAAVQGSSWNCTASGGATCSASGSGSISTSAMTLPSNSTVTFTITGLLDPAAVCGSTVTNSASADFGSSSSLVDPDPTNNSASIDTTVTCTVTLLANPTTLSFGPQTVGAPSAAQTITVTGNNGATITGIVATGDFSQTNDCGGAALNGTSCTIQVVFTPSAEGTRSGTLTITSSAASSPTSVTLTGTGTNAVPGKFTFVPLNDVAPSTMQVSNPITVTGTNVPTTISVSGGAQYSINGGAYTSNPGVVPPGAQITLRVSASPSYGTTVTAAVTIGGVAASFAVTTGPQLQDLTVTSGGGSVSPLMLAALALLVLMRIGRARVSVAATLVLVLVGLSTRPAAAADWEAMRSSFYFGGGLGNVTSTLTAGKVTDRLQADGYQVVASHVDRSSLSANLYVGYELSRHFALEFGWSYLGRTRTAIQGLAPPDLQQLLFDASRVTRGGGDAWSLLGRYRWDLRPKLSLDLRGGPYRWVTHSDLWIGSAEQLNRNDRGWGWALGAGPRYALSDHWALALGVNYFASTSDNRFVQVGATVEYHLH